MEPQVWIVVMIICSCICCRTRAADTERSLFLRQMRSGTSDQLIAHYAAPRLSAGRYEYKPYGFEIWREVNNVQPEMVLLPEIRIIEDQQEEGREEQREEQPQPQQQGLKKADIYALLRSQQRYRCRHMLGLMASC